MNMGEMSLRCNWGMMRNVLMMALVSVSLLAGRVEGLECYECLSLNCPSGAVCSSIKKTMLEIFVPKRHVIHFDPNDPCPESEDPKNSTRWSNLSRQCQRSDSVCLVSPIEILSLIEGSKGGKVLEQEYELTTTGYLRGCASRRKLLENDPTIKVKVNLLSTIKNKSNDAGAGGGASASGANSGTSSGGLVYNMMSTEDTDDLSKLTFDDDFIIRKVHSHTFYIDQWTDDATRCYEDNCNTKVKIKSSANINCRDSLFILISLITNLIVFNQNYFIH